MTSSRTEHAYLATNGVTLHVVRAGPTDGPLVVLLHGFPEFWYSWSHYIESLAAAGYRVLAPDQRGYNLSDKPLRVADYDIEQLVGDVLGLIELEGRKKACVIGHDWGAAVTWWLAMRHPERVEYAAVMNMPHPLVMRRFLFGANVRQLLRSWYIFYFQLPWLPEETFGPRRARRNFQRLRDDGAPSAFAPEDEAVYVEAWSRPGAARGMIDWYRAAMRAAVRPLPEDIRVSPPMDIIWGKQDTVLGAEMVGPSLELCADGRVTWFERATHWVNHEERAEVTARLLERLPPAGRR